MLTLRQTVIWGLAVTAVELVVFGAAQKPSDFGAIRLLPGGVLCVAQPYHISVASVARRQLIEIG